MPSKPVNRFKFYIDITINEEVVKKSLDQNGLIDIEWNRRLISIYVSLYHSICKKRNLRGFPIDILEFQYNSLGVKALKLRIYAKKSGSLLEFYFGYRVISIISKTATISEILEVPAQIDGFTSLVRVRVPTIKKGLSIKESLLKDPDLQYLTLMPSSSKLSNKRLIRYFYKRIEVVDDDHNGVVDSYGFSVRSRTTTMPVF